MGLLLLVGCQYPAPPRPTPEGELDLFGAVDEIAYDLSRQMSPPRRTRLLVVDPFVSRSTGEHTNGSLRAQGELVPRLESYMSGLSVLPFDSTGVEEAPLVLTGTVQPTEPPDRYSLSVAVTDRPSGLVVARSVVRFLEPDFDQSPTPLYQDSPSIVRDRFTDGYVETTETDAGQPADALYVEQIPTQAVLDQAREAYDGGRWEDALALYRAAESRSDGQRLVTFNGLYLAHMRLGDQDAAEEAFARIAALGLATNNLAVKFLFRPGSSTEFWPGEGFADVYPMWIRQIARAVEDSGSCLEIVGHTSRTGSEELNLQLSRDRATNTRELLEAEVPSISGQLRTNGVGFRENMIGSGTDDAVDALDRRVEFEVLSCGD